MELNKYITLKDGLFWGALIFFMVTLCLAWIFESPVWVLVPVILVIGIFLLKDLSLLFYLLLLSIPFSSEIDIAPGMALDLPSEPLMLALLVVCFLWLIMNKKPWGDILLHPVTILLLFHIGWMTLCAINSVDTTVSFKFMLAKYWYIAAFYISSWFFIKSGKDVKTLFWCLYLPVLFTVLWVLIRHASTGFVFESINSVVRPFYRNHVDYASLLALFYPFVWIARRWYEKGSWQRKLILFGMLLLPIGIYFSYTRAAIGILFIYPLVYLVLRLKMVKWTLIIVAASVIGAGIYFLNEKEYLALAPNYEKTIYHDEFGNLLEATYKLEDLSTMERLYRWVAGGHMLMERPWMGTGPGTFYPTYQAYTVSSFQTYTSHNPEKSGVHNYYLMTATDQGVIGLLIFLVFIVFVLLFTENLYHQAHRDKSEKILIACLFSIFCGILIINTINDMLENIKVGALFFLCLALIAQLGRHYSLSPPIKDNP